MTTSSTTDSSSGVTKDMINAASAEFQRRLGLWQDRHDNVDVDEALDCCGIPPLVIARGVTPAMLEEIPYEWLKGRVVSLNADGVLEMTDVKENEHKGAKSATFTCLGAYETAHYTPANGLEAVMEKKGIYFGESSEPDMVLSAFYPPRQRTLPMVVAEVDIHNRTIPKIIERARRYLAEPHVHRVVAFKIFKARSETFTSGNLSKAAVTIEFERDGDFQPGVLAAIRVVQEVSFGTGELHDSVLATLSDVPSREFPAGVIRSIAPSPLQTEAISASAVDATFPETVHPFVVDLAPRMVAPLTFDLNRVFRYAATGWNKDREMRATLATS